MNQERLSRMMQLLDEIEDLVYDSTQEDYSKASQLAGIVDGVNMTKEKIEKAMKQENRLSKKILITIHTDSDFSITYKQKNLKQQDEKVYIICKDEKDFANKVLSGEITSNNEKGCDVLEQMIYSGDGCYGNYSLSIEKYVPFVHELK